MPRNSVATSHVDNLAESNAVVTAAEDCVEQKPQNTVNLDISVPVYLPMDDNKPETDQFEIVCVNGRNYQIALGAQVTVPYRVFEALYNSGRFKRL